MDQVKIGKTQDPQWIEFRESVQRDPPRKSKEKYWR